MTKITSLLVASLFVVKAFADDVDPSAAPPTCGVYSVFDASKLVGCFDVSQTFPDPDCACPCPTFMQSLKKSCPEGGPIIDYWTNLCSPIPVDASKCNPTTTIVAPQKTSAVVKPAKTSTRAGGNNIKPTVSVSGGGSADAPDVNAGTSTEVDASQGNVANIASADDTKTSVGGTGTAAGSSQKPAKTSLGQKTLVSLVLLIGSMLV